MRKTLTRIGLTIGAATFALALGATSASAAPAEPTNSQPSTVQESASAGWIYLASYGSSSTCEFMRTQWPYQWYPTCFYTGYSYDLYIYA